MKTNPQHLDVAVAAYNEVWQGWSGIDAHNVDLVRRTGMAAAFHAASIGEIGLAPSIAWQAVCDAFEANVPATSELYLKYRDAVVKVVDGKMPCRQSIEIITKLIAAEGK